VYFRYHGESTVRWFLKRFQRPWAWTFQRAINEGRASPLTSPKLGSDTQICRFSQRFRHKAVKVYYEVSLSKDISGAKL